MLKPIAAIVTAVALFLIDRLSLPFAPCSEHRTVQSDQETPNNDNCAVHEGLIIAGMERLAEIKPEVWTALATIAIAVFTLTLWLSSEKMWRVTRISAIATRRSALAARKAVDAAREEFHSTHRPRIRIKAVFLMNERIHYSQPVQIRVVCVNSGVGDARINSYGIDCFVLKKDTSVPPDKRIDPIDFTQPSILSSGISTALPDFFYSITNGDEAQIRIEQASLYCMGFVHYWDGVGRTRMTAFCRALRLDSPRGLHTRGRFHRTDEPDYEYED
jgi:hypothetical protein